MTLPANSADINRQSWVDIAPGQTARRVTPVAGPPGSIQPTGVAVQAATLLNSRQISAANAAQAITLAAVAGARNVLRKIALFASASANATLSVTIGSVVYDLGTVALTTEAKAFVLDELTAPDNTALVVNVGAAGAGITTTLSVVADRT